MKVFLKSKLVFIVAAFIMIAAAAVVPLSSSITRSHAQGAATATINPSQGPAGTQVFGTGSNWTSGHQIKVELENGTVLATTTVGNDGTFTVPFTIPTNAPQGNLTIDFVDATGNLGFFIPATFTVTSGTLFTLSFTKKAAATVKPGGSLTYTITITNTSPTGTESIHDLHVTDPLPSQLTAITTAPILTITPTTGGFGDCNGTSGLTVSCTIDNFDPGAVAIITFSASVNSKATGTITNLSTAVSNTTPVSAVATAQTTVTSRKQLFVFLQGIDTELTTGQVTDSMNGDFGAFNTTLETILGINSFVNSKALFYSYANSDFFGYPAPYTCVSTFTQPIKTDAILLGRQIVAALTHNPTFKGNSTDVHLIAHSLGGVVAFSYLTALYKTTGVVPSLPVGDTLKDVITLDSPIGGVSDSSAYFNLAATIFQNLPRRIIPFQGPCGVPSDRLTSVKNLENIFKTTSKPTFQMVESQQH